MHPLKRWQRLLTARLAQLYESSTHWQGVKGAIPPRPLSGSDRWRMLVGLPFFNRRAGRFYTGQNNPETPSQLAQRPGWHLDWAEVAPGIRLTGAVCPPRAPSAPWLLYFMGNWGNQLVKSQQWLEEFRGTHDWGLALWAPRGFETSEGVPNMKNACADAHVLHDRLVRVYGAREGGIHLVGFSLGAALAGDLTSRLSKAGKPPVSLTLLSLHPYDSTLRRTSSSWTSHWLVPEWHGPIVQAGDLPGPTLVIYVTDDSFEPVHLTRQFVASLGERCRYVELPQGGHEASTGTEAVALIRAFIEECEFPHV